MAGLTNFRPDVQQTVETGFVIVTEDSGAGMVDIHDRRPVVLEPEDALTWMDPDTPVEEAAHIAQTRSIPTEEFIWWKVDRAVNRSDPNNNGPPSADAHKRDLSETAAFFYPCSTFAPITASFNVVPRLNLP